MSDLTRELYDKMERLQRRVALLEAHPGGFTGGTIPGPVTLDGYVQTEWNKPILDVRPEWNNSSIAGEGVTVDATNIASRSDSTLFQGKVGGALSWRVRQGGLVQHYGATPGIDLIGTGGGWDYASINFVADLATDKFWRIRHRQAEAHEFQIAADDGTGEKKIIRLTMAGLLRLFHKLLIESGTLTDPTDHLAITGTWNDAADTFRVLYSNVTNTASHANSRLMELEIGGTDKFVVDLDGLLRAGGLFSHSARATGTLTLTTTEQDIPGASTTVTHAGTYLILGIFDFNLAGGATASMAIGLVNVNGSSDTSNTAIHAPPLNGTTRATVAQWWVKAVGAGQTVKLRAYKNANYGTYSAMIQHTGLVALKIA